MLALGGSDTDRTDPHDAASAMAVGPSRVIELAVAAQSGLEFGRFTDAGTAMAIADLGFTTMVHALSAPAELVQAIIDSTREAFGMAGRKIRCVGLITVPMAEDDAVTGIIAVYGRQAGFIHLGLSEPLAVLAVSGLLQESLTELNATVVDGVAELTNIIAGGVKVRITRSAYGFSGITTPSVLIAQDHTFSIPRGALYLRASFEIDEPQIVRQSQRLLHVSLSLVPTRDE